MIEGRPIEGKGKGQMNDMGVHVPFLIRVPISILAKIAERYGTSGKTQNDNCASRGREIVVHEPHDSTAVLPSLLEVVGLNLASSEPGARIDGRSVWSTILGHQHSCSSNDSFRINNNDDGSFAFSQFAFYTPDFPLGLHLRMVRDERWLLVQPADQLCVVLSGLFSISVDQSSISRMCVFSQV